MDSGTSSKGAAAGGFSGGSANGRMRFAFPWNWGCHTTTTHLSAGGANCEVLKGGIET